MEINMSGKERTSPEIRQQLYAEEMYGSAVLVVVGEATSEDHKVAILERVKNGFASWDEERTGCDIIDELEALATEAPSGVVGDNGEHIVKHGSEVFQIEILINPRREILYDGIKLLLLPPTKHKHIIFSGYSFTGTGDWILQDSTWSFTDLTNVFKHGDVQLALNEQTGSTLTIHCGPPYGSWTQQKVQDSLIGQHLNVSVNPAHRLVDPSSLLQFSAYLDSFLQPTLNDLSDYFTRVRPADELLPTSDMVGSIRFSRPGLYVFPAGQGDCAVLGLDGFSMLIDGGFARRSCFWKFTRHVEKHDMLLVTRINQDNLFGVKSLLQRCLSGEELRLNLPYSCFNTPTVGVKDKDCTAASPLSVSLVEESSLVSSFLKQVSSKPNQLHCSPTPVQLFSKIGYGVLEMYVLNPCKDSEQYKEMMKQWSNGAEHFTSNKAGIPLNDACSLAVLLVWKSHNGEIKRILYPGSTPQTEIFKSLEQLKHLDVFKYRHGRKLSEEMSKQKHTPKSNRKPLSPVVADVKPVAADLHKDVPELATQTVEATPSTDEYEDPGPPTERLPHVIDQTEPGSVPQSVPIDAWVKGGEPTTLPEPGLTSQESQVTPDTSSVADAKCEVEIPAPRIPEDSKHEEATSPVSPKPFVGEEVSEPELLQAAEEFGALSSPPVDLLDVDVAPAEPCLVDTAPIAGDGAPAEPCLVDTTPIAGDEAQLIGDLGSVAPPSDFSQLLTEESELLSGARSIDQSPVDVKEGSLPLTNPSVSEEGAAIYADSIIAPPEDVVPPNDSMITPTDSVITPTNEDIAPVEDVADPTTDVIAPADNATEPMKDPNTLTQLDDNVLTSTRDVCSPTNDITASSADVIAPADVITPSDDVIALIDDIMPTDDVMAPTNDVIAPTDDVIVPVDDVIAPTDDIMPTDDVIAPTDDVIAPTDDVITSTDDDITPTVEGVVPTEEDVSPTDEAITSTSDIKPTDDVIAPTGDVIAPTGDVITPADDVTSFEDLLTPAEDLAFSLDVAPQSDDVAPQSDDVAPQSDDVAPQSDDVAPQSDDVAPQSDDVAPQSDDVAPQSDDVASQSEDIAPQSVNVAPQMNPAMDTDLSQLYPPTSAEEVHQNVAPVQLSDSIESEESAAGIQLREDSLEPSHTTDMQQVDNLTHESDAQTPTASTDPMTQSFIDESTIEQADSLTSAADQSGLDSSLVIGDSTHNVTAPERDPMTDSFIDMSTQGSGDVLNRSFCDQSSSCMVDESNSRIPPEDLHDSITVEYDESAEEVAKAAAKYQNNNSIGVTSAPSQGVNQTPLTKPLVLPSGLNPLAPAFTPSVFSTTTIAPSSVRPAGLLSYAAVVGKTASTSHPIDMQKLMSAATTANSGGSTTAGELLSGWLEHDCSGCQSHDHIVSAPTSSSHNNNDSAAAKFDPLKEWGEPQSLPLPPSPTPADSPKPPAAQRSTPSTKAATPSTKAATPSTKTGTPSTKAATPSTKAATPTSKTGTPTSKTATPTSRAPVAKKALPKSTSARGGPKPTPTVTGKTGPSSTTPKSTTAEGAAAKKPAVAGSRGSVYKSSVAGKTLGSGDSKKPSTTGTASEVSAADAAAGKRPSKPSQPKFSRLAAASSAATSDKPAEKVKSAPAAKSRPSVTSKVDAPKPKPTDIKTRPTTADRARPQVKKSKPAAADDISKKPRATGIQKARPGTGRAAPALSAKATTADAPGPFYVDIAYIPHHGDGKYVGPEYFNRIHASQYIFSGLDYNADPFEALLVGKKSWPSDPVTLIPTYDVGAVDRWQAEHRQQIAELNIKVATSANHCTITVSEDEQFNAVRLEF